MDRQQRRDLKHDKFVDEIGSLSARAKENQRLLLTIAAAAVILAVLGYGIYFYRANREEKAQIALGAAIDTMESPLLAAPGAQPVPGAKFKTEAERTAAAEKQFKDVEASHGGTDAADVASLYLARIAADKGDVSSARTRLQKFVSDHPKHLLVAGARYSLYRLRIDGGEAPQVAQELQAEIAKPDPPLPADSLLSLLAHSFDVQGNSQKSKETYRRIATEFPDSPYAIDAQRKMGPA
ncbi:MAG: tetratricopeptide repeat protein [Acidobacteria bacterium]|nr:tetratricopeptide repeat protein [Acidobacteriota bacterium]MBV9068761.1 tetratricopeptide repeat protein [Acidobacteriota bacterium]MBV9188315.1 tetratricopeptide repeat protein [Acidobacteriota bacterium]